MKTKFGSLKRSTKLTNLQLNGLRNKKRKLNMLNESGNTISFYKNKTLRLSTREHYKQLYTKKLDKLDEMDTFLETQNLSSLTQKEIENRNRPKTSKETESVIKNLSTRKSPEPDSFIGELY